MNNFRSAASLLLILPSASFATDESDSRAPARAEVQRFFDAWQAKDLSAASGYLTGDVTVSPEKPSPNDALQLSPIDFLKRLQPCKFKKFEPIPPSVDPLMQYLVMNWTCPDSLLIDDKQPSANVSVRFGVHSKGKGVWITFYTEDLESVTQ